MSNSTSSQGFPFYSSLISCGLFGIADDFTEKHLSLDDKFFVGKPSIFLVRADGDSMSPQIEPGDILVVDRAKKLVSGCIGAFFYQGNAVCKQYVKVGEKIILHSVNNDYPDLVVETEDDLQVFGVVVGMCRDF